MRIVIAFAVFALSATLAAQQPGPRGGGAGPQGGGAAPAGGRGGPAAPAIAYKNLKVLPANADIPFAMQIFTEALGVTCAHCHTGTDFASDENPKKEIARTMIALVRQIDLTFPSSNGVFPAGYHEVDCMTCHRGSVKPETKAAKEFHNRGEFLRGEMAPDLTPGVNLKVLAPGAQVHGGRSVMHDFTSALSVDCGYCHGGGRPFESESNPRKLIARNMISMVNQINSHFPGSGPFPTGNQMVTCWTCHRGSPSPTSFGNKDWGPSKVEPRK